MYSTNTNISVGDMPVFLASDTELTLSEIINAYPEPQLYAVEGSASMNDCFSLMLGENQAQKQVVTAKSWWQFW